MSRETKRIFLSPPHMGGDEPDLVREAFKSNYIAPVGPQIARFERVFAEYLGAGHPVAVSSGTAALHLALRLAGVGPGDEVACSDLTFIASASPVVYQGARPVFIDSGPKSWNMDPDLLADFLETRARKRRLPKAVVLTDIYGQPADADAVREMCEERGITLIEDAAEALGALYKGRPAGTLGHMSAFSFNGNKIITTSGGGMFWSGDKKLSDKARSLATQARQDAPHYEHIEVGYNYRMSNILAAIGLGQMRVLPERVEQKRRIFEMYAQRLGEMEQIQFMPEDPGTRATRWLTCVTFAGGSGSAVREAVRLALEEQNIESRPVWKPMHMQPVFSECEIVGGEFSEDKFMRGLCLPSGTAMTEDEMDRVCAVVRKTLRKAP